MGMQKSWPQQNKAQALPVQTIDDAVETEEEAPSAEQSLVRRLKAGDEIAFNQLVGQYHTSLLRLARNYVRSQSSAEEVVQETWMGVLQRLPFFEERSSLKTWMIRILINRASTHALRDQRLIPFSSLAEREEESGAFAGELESLIGGWISLTEDRYDIPEVCLLSSETHACVVRTIEALPANQRAVMVLSDIKGWRPEEICTQLGISMMNQRVLLHRARSKVRRILEKYFEEE